MSDLANRAISGQNPEDYDRLRKLLALGISLSSRETTGQQATVIADKETFSKKVNYAVGSGKLSQTQAVETMADRKAAITTTIARKTLSFGVNMACAKVGKTLGACVGHPVLGEIAGRAVGHFLNEPISRIIYDGYRIVRTMVSAGWQKVKEIGRSIQQTISNWLFS